MPLEAFSDPWLQGWVEEIRNSEVYRQSAASWEGSLCLEVQEPDDPSAHKAVFLDLWHGDCRGAHMASQEDLAEATFVLTAPLATWKQVFFGKVDPIFGIMVGKIRLSRGNVAKLAPYMQASKELVAAAVRIDTIFPDD